MKHINAYGYKRRQRRFNSKFPILFDFFGAKRNGLVINFSKTGLFMQCHTLPDPGEILELSCSIDDKLKNVRLVGRVVWARSGIYSALEDMGRGLGIDLISPPSEYLSLVQRFQSAFETPEGPREAPRLLAKHRVMYKSGLEFLTEYCEDLSRGGMYLATNSMLKKDEEIPLRLELPGITEPLEIMARVAHTLSEEESQAIGKSPGVGLQFLDLPPEAIYKIQTYLTKLKLYQFFEKRGDAFEAPVKGLLKNSLVPELLMSFDRQKANGILEIDSIESIKRIYLKEGKPYYIESHLPQERFELFLIKHGFVSQEDLTKLQNKNISTERDLDLWMTLRRMPLMSASQLEQVWINHQKDKLMNIFSIFEGSYQLLPLPQKNLGIPQTRALGLWEVMLGGVQRCYDRHLIKAWLNLTPESRIYTVNTGPMTPDVPPKVVQLVDYFKLPRTFHTFCKEHKKNEEEALYELFSAYLCGWIHIQLNTGHPQ